MTLTRPAFFLALLLFGSACGSPDRTPSAAAPSTPDTVAPTGEWITVLEVSMDRRSTGPERFESRSDSLRVITTMGTSSSRYLAGLIITNVLSDASSLPIASVRVEQRRLTEVSADTTVVEAPPGPLSLFVAQHRGFTDWTIVVQEFRPLAANGVPRPLP